MRRHCAFVNCRRIKITPSVAILNHIREPEGIPYMSTGPRVGFEAEKSRRLLNVRVAQQRTDRDEPHLFSSPSAGQLYAGC